jgi:DNA-directed RNA polymerase subunit B
MASEKSTPSEEELAALFTSFMRKDLPEFQRVAFDRLLSEWLPALLHQFLTLTTEYPSDSDNFYTLALQNIRVTRDQPLEKCMQYNLRFGCLVLGDFVLSCTKQSEIARSADVTLLSFPLLTGRTLLSYPAQDHDYTYPRCFVNNGKLRTIPCTLASAADTPLLYTTKERFILEFRSSHADKLFRSTSTLEFSIAFNGARALEVKIPFQKTRLSIGVLALAFSCSSQTFVDLIRANAAHRYDAFVFEPFEMALRAAALGMDRDAACIAISKLANSTTLSTAEHILRNEIFPHLRDDDAEVERLQKCATLANLACTLILYSANAFGDDAFRERADIASHTLVTGAEHLGSLLRLALIDQRTQLLKMLRRTLNESSPLSACDLSALYNETRLSNRIWRALATGSWSARRSGVSHQLNTTNTWSFRAQDRRVSSQLNPEGTHYDTRAVKDDQYGVLCAANGAAGEVTGLTTELACTASATPHTSAAAQRHFARLVIKEIGHTFVALADFCNAPFALTPPSALLLCPAAKILGVCRDAHLVVAAVYKLRRSLRVSPFAGVAYERAFATIALLHGGGYLTRPLAILNAATTLASQHFDEALRTQRVEYVCKREEVSLCRVAIAPRYITTSESHFTHIELSEASFLGVIAASVPFVTSQQAPRLNYWCNQIKQTIACEPLKNETNAPAAKQLYYCHTPLSFTRVGATQNLNGLFTPMVIAVITQSPQAQEDGIVIKRESIQYGAAMAASMKAFTSEALPHVAAFGGGDNCDAAYKCTARYSKVDAELGIPKTNTKMQEGDVVIAKVVKRARAGDLPARYVDASTAIKARDCGTVTRSQLKHTPSGSLVRVTLQSELPLAIGDKISTQHSQKGIVARIEDAADLPFSSSGIIPDMVISAKSVLSRRTQATLLEILTGKSVALEADMRYALDEQRFGDNVARAAKTLGELLHKHGFASDGAEKLCDGRTGLPLPGRVFMGVGSVVRLSHIASAKLHARQYGPLNKITRQPTTGRSHGGGLRLSHMELNALTSLGASKILQERTRELSDLFKITVCTQCLRPIDVANTSIRYYFCQRCENSAEHARTLHITFAFHKLLLELLSTHVDVRLEIEDEKEEQPYLKQQHSCKKRAREEKQESEIQQLYEALKLA